MMYRVYQSIGLAFLFIPINTICYVGVPQEQNNQISSMINLTRNLGGSFGISFVATMLPGAPRCIRPISLPIP